MTTIEQTMTIPAVVSRAGGSVDGPDSLIDATIPTPPTPTGHDLLVEVKAVSVNPVDVKVRASGNRGGTDRVLGWDAAGTVIAVGEEVTLFRPGDDVYYAGAIERPGSYASRQLVDERIVGPKPTSLSYAEAAALPLTGITAWEALFDKLGLTEDSTGTLACARRRGRGGLDPDPAREGAHRGSGDRHRLPARVPRVGALPRRGRDRRSQCG